MKKLRSNKGASLSFALLLFLVCAVLSGVILAAATAAAGRFSELAKMDQRYYAVTSAAELLRDELDEQTVTITRRKTVPYDRIIHYKMVEEDGVEKSVFDYEEIVENEAEAVFSWDFSITTKNASGDYQTLLLSKAAIGLVFGDVNQGDAWDGSDWNKDDLYEIPEYSQDLYISLTDVPTVKVHMTVGADATVYLTIFNTIVKDGKELTEKDQYQLNLTLNPLVTLPSGEPEDYTTDTGSEHIYEKITTIQWDSGAIRKGDIS